MGRLVAGPWVGEFGWELFNWQGRVRYLADFYDEVIVGCREGSKYLYEDFATDFFFVDTGDCETENNLCHGYNFKPTAYITATSTWEDPQKLPFYIDNGVPTIGMKKQKFIKYGNTEDYAVNKVIIHARNTNKCGTGDRDWPQYNWEELVKMISSKYEIISIGTKKESLHIEGTVDLRGAPLDKVCEEISTSKCIVGPSSGPIHLASLCGTSQIVWSGHSRNKYRYEELWNPHKAQVIYLGDGGWQPSIGYVYKTVKQFLFDKDDDFKI